MEQEKSVSTRQFVIFFFIISLTKKFLMLPILMLKVSGRDAVFSLAIFCIADLAIFFMLLVVWLRNKDVTFFEFIEMKFKKTGSVIIMVVFIIYSLAKLMKLLTFIENYYTMSLFSEVFWMIFSIPLFVVLAHFAVRSLRSLVRTAELFSFFIILANVSLIFLISSNFDFVKLLPLWGDEGAMPFKGILMMPAWFGEYMLMVLFMGKVKMSKNFSKTMIIGCICATVVSFLVICLIFTSYVDIAHYIDYGKKISSVTQIGISRLNFGRFDLLLFCITMISIILSAGLYLNGIVRCTERMLNMKEQKNIVGIAWGIAVYILFTVFLSREQVVFFILTSVMNYFMWAVNLLLPLTLMLASFTKRRSSYGSRKRNKAAENTNI